MQAEGATVAQQHAKVDMCSTHIPAHRPMTSFVLIKVLSTALCIWVITIS